MSRQQRRSSKLIPMHVVNDPASWRYQSVHEALVAGTGILVQLIREGERIQANRIDEGKQDSLEAATEAVTA